MLGLDTCLAPLARVEALLLLPLPPVVLLVNADTVFSEKDAAAERTEMNEMQSCQRRRDAIFIHISLVNRTAVSRTGRKFFVYFRHGIHYEERLMMDYVPRYMQMYLGT
jgi:hypothetical protein